MSIYTGPIQNQHHANASEVQWPNSIPNSNGLYYTLPALLATLFGVEGLHTAHADAEELWIYQFLICC